MLLRWIGGIVGTLALGLAAMALVGTAVERAHSATVTRVHPAAPEEVWARLAAVEEFPRWRTGVAGVEVRERDGDRVVAWTETTGFGPMPLRVVESDRPRLLVGRIDADDLGFGGTWTYRLEPEETGTRLSITEDGVIENPLFRFLSRFVFGYEKTLRAYQDDLARSFAGGGAAGR